MAYNSNWFQSVEKKPIPTAPAFSKTLQIDKIAPGSPAADLKLRPGDKLLSVNGKAALIEDIPTLLANSSSVQYRFFLPRESAFLEVATQGLPLGIQASVSSDGIAEQYTSKAEFEKEGMLTLWERGDYQHIRGACAIANKRLNKRNLLGKLTGKAKSFSFTKLMGAICDIEAGKTKAGYDMLSDYASEHAHAETSDVGALLDYYRGLRAKDEKHMDAYQSHIESAYSSYPDSERIRQEAAKAGVEIDRADNRVGRSIQTDQSWTYLEGGEGSTSIGALLAAMAPQQVLPLCMMPTYRGNGPYNDALLPYIAVQPHIGERLHSLVVLTDVSEKRKDRPHWNSNEELAKKTGCPLIVLHGSFDQIMNDFALRAAPEFFALNKDGKVIWAGSLAEDYAYWDLVAQT